MPLLTTGVGDETADVDEDEVVELREVVEVVVVVVVVRVVVVEVVVVVVRVVLVDVVVVVVRVVVVVVVGVTRLDVLVPEELGEDGELDEEDESEVVVVVVAHVVEIAATLEDTDGVDSVPEVVETDDSGVVITVLENTEPSSLEVTTKAELNPEVDVTPGAASLMLEVICKDEVGWNGVHRIAAICISSLLTIDTVPFLR